MQAVCEILQAHGYDSVDEMAVGDHVKVEVPGFEDLVIEKIGDSRISVAHYYTQRGDLMADPDIVFRINDDGSWTAIEYTHHGLGIYRHNENGLRDAAQFAVTWNENLQNQGFVEAAQEAAATEVTA